MCPRHRHFQIESRGDLDLLIQTRVRVRVRAKAKAKAGVRVSVTSSLDLEAACDERGMAWGADSVVRPVSGASGVWRVRCVVGRIGTGSVPVPRCRYRASTGW